METFIEFWIAKAIVDAGLVVGLLLIFLVVAGLCVGLKKLSEVKR